MKHKQKKKTMFLFTILIFIFLIGCKDIGYRDTDINQGLNNGENQGNTDKTTPIEGGELSLPLTNFTTLNPLLTDNSSYYHFSKLIFEGLFEFDENLKPYPKLAESYSISEDGKKVSIKLKQGITWHDGESLTSEDIAFTIEAIKRANMDGTYAKVFKEASLINGYLNLNSFINTNIIDSSNIEIIFDRKFSNIIDILTFPIIPKHGFENIDQALSIENYKIIGTGPFKFIDYEKFKTVNLKRNEAYWDNPVYIDRIIGKVLDDKELILTSFETGQIDLALSLDVDWDKYRQNERIEVYEYPSSNYEFLGFNFQKGIFSNEQGIAIRKAINYGINRQNIIRNQYLGHGTGIDVPIHPNSYLLSDNSSRYGHNINFAKEELKKVGYLDINEDGILEDESGNPLRLTILTNTHNIFRLRTAEVIAEDLKKIGIDLSIVQNRDEDTLITQEKKDIQWNNMQNILKRGNYDIVLLGWKTSIIPNISYMFHSSNIIDTNFIKYQDEEMDKLLGQTINGSLDEKMENYNKLQNHILDKLPYVSLFYKNQALLVDSKLKGELSPKFFNLYYGLDKCFIVTQEKME